MTNLNYEKHGELLRAMLGLEELSEVGKFLEDICTVKEIEAMSQRLEVARLLREGKNYNEVSAITGASTATISRVNKCLLYGSGGYGIVLDRAGSED